MVPDSSVTDNLEHLVKRRQEILEDRVVREIFEAAGLRNELQDFRNESAGKAISLGMFGKRFPRFPIRLSSTEASYLGWCDFWSSFKKNPLYSEYLTQFARAPFLGQGYYGLVLPAGPIGLMIMHNDIPRDREGEEETRIERVYGRRKTRIVVEPLSLVLQGIPADWYGGAANV